VNDQSASIPANWSTIASRPYLPVVDGIYDEGPVHLQDKQYKKGKIITQSAVGLLQYPLEVPMPTQLKINDLMYWQSHTADNGFYTGDSSYSIAWLALGNRTGSDAQFGRAFLYLNGLPSKNNVTRVVAPQFNPFVRILPACVLNHWTCHHPMIESIVRGVCLTLPL
jgi:hypothetical protein